LHWYSKFDFARVASSAERCAGIPDPSATRLRRQFSVFFISTGVSLLLLTTIAYSWMLYQQHHLKRSLTNTVVTDSSDVTQLSIPRIHLEAAILEGTDSRSLLLAPGHIKDSAMPGESGNSVIAAHRDTFFRHIHELKLGDDIYVRRNDRVFHYTVDSKRVVDPSDIAVAAPTGDSRLTLVTCYPTYFIGPAPQRLVVIARLQSDPVSPE